MKKSYVYILTNSTNRVLYVGVTSNLNLRIVQHKSKYYKGFTSRYNCNKLVYFEEFTSINDAIIREKQLKAGSRSNKLRLINRMNPEWLDLFDNFKDVYS
ncbi:MAG: GIY-YIG nuclease family protein [Flavobacteriaceae bacterium]|nr:GIY-YIG nuclease family protein [Flavobacteriaceae bacterium]